MNACMHAELLYIHAYHTLHCVPFHSTPLHSIASHHITLHYATLLHNIHTYLLTYVHTYIRTYIHTYLHAYIPTYVLTYIHMYIHTHRYTRLCGGCIKISTYWLCAFVCVHISLSASKNITYRLLYCMPIYLAIDFSADPIEPPRLREHTISLQNKGHLNTLGHNP